MKYQNHEMSFMPININLSGREILIVGGGKVAYQKIKGIRLYSDNIRVVALEVCNEIKELELSHTLKEYDTSDLGDSFIVYACTNSKELNQQIYNDAHAKGKLVNVVDNPPLCDFVSPAVFKKGHMTVAVGSNGQDIHASKRWRDKIKQYLMNNPVD